MGVIYRGLNQLEVSKKYFYKAVELHTAMKDPNIVVSFTGLGSLYFEEKEIDSAELYLTKELIHLERKDNVDYRAEVLHGLFLVKQEQGDYLEAISYLNQHLELTKFIAKSSQSKEAKEIESKYNYFSQQEKIEDLKQEQAFSDLEKRQSTFNQRILVFAMLTVLLVLIYIGFLYKRTSNGNSTQG